MCLQPFGVKFAIEMSALVISHRRSECGASSDASLGAFLIMWGRGEAAIVCVFQLTPLVRTKKNNACQLGFAVLTRCPGFCLFVWGVFLLFFFLPPAPPPLPHPTTDCPQPETTRTEELKKKVVPLSVPQMRLRGKPPRSTVEVWRRFWAASLHPRPQRWPTNQALPVWWSHIWSIATSNLMPGSRFWGLFTRYDQTWLQTLTAKYFRVLWSAHTFWLLFVSAFITFLGGVQICCLVQRCHKLQNPVLYLNFFIFFNKVENSPRSFRFLCH